MYKRLIDYIHENGILTDCQYGFRSNGSTNYAIIELVDKITKAIENNEFTVGIFLDLSKAFDTVNHDILLSKLYFYGIRGSCHAWIKDYLSNRKQIVKYNQIRSSERLISCGVPQGSVIGPLLFLIISMTLLTQPLNCLLSYLQMTQTCSVQGKICMNLKLQ